ncbi:MAG: TadE/TadG family type IV pilus assembly protein [Gaiellaceae bacterium]
MRRHLNRERIRNEKGQAITELALVLPILAVLLFGIIQFGIVFNHYVTLTDAVRAGARKAVVSRQEASPAGVAAQAVRDSAEDLPDAGDPAVLEVQVSPGTPWASGSDVTVTAWYPYDISLLGWVVKSGRLSSTTTERVE